MNIQFPDKIELTNNFTISEGQDCKLIISISDQDKKAFNDFKSIELIFDTEAMINALKTIKRNNVLKGE